MVDNKKQSNLNEADKALKSFLNDIILKPLDERLSSYTPKLIKEIKYSIADRFEEITNKFENQYKQKFDSLFKLPESLGTLEDNKTVARLLEELKNHLNTLPQKIVLIKSKIFYKIIRSLMKSLF